MKTVDQVLRDRYRRGVARLRTALIAAACLHLGVAGAVAVGTQLGRQAPEPLEFVAVRVVPAAALGRPDPPPARKPEPKPPEPEPPAPEPETAPEPPPTRPLRLDEVDVSMPPDPPPEPPRRRVRPPREPEPPRQRQGSPQGNPLATSRLGSQMGVDNPDFTYDYYLDRLLALIEARWRRPGGDPPDQAVVHFRIHRDGSASEIEILETSGSRPFDLAALRAVESATPFPPLPTSYRKDSLGVSLIVY